MAIVSIRTQRDALEKTGRPDDLLGDVSRQIPRLDDVNQMATATGNPARVADDHARFAKLVLPYLGDAYSLARWITGSRADAEDVVQEASLRAFRAINSFADGNSRPWVLTIVRNTAYTWMRKNRPATVMTVEDLEAVEATQVDAGASEDGTPEAALIAKADAACLQAAIADLPTAYRETLILRDVQGLAYREISDVTGVPIGTVMSRLARGRNRVMKAIGRKAS
jgi:RNA polymerase sigma factor (sigma-70 family)